MARTKVTKKNPDFSGIKKAIQDLTIKTGFKLEEIAKETAPVGVNPPVDAGNYRSQIRYDGANEVVAHAKYSAAIEYGFDNYEENVKEHERVISQAFGKPITPKTVTVKAHTRTMNRKPNPVMRNAAAKVQKEIPQLWKEVQKENGL